MKSYFQKVFDYKTYLVTVLAIVTFSDFLVILFSQTIPGTILTFFKMAGEFVILGSVFVFALFWLIKARPCNRSKQYSVIIFDVFGKKSQIDGVRTEFNTHDVAWSFMKQYKKEFPLHNFALVSKQSESEKPTIFRYI